MWRTVTSISSLLLGTAILLLGNGLLGTTVGIRAGIAGWSPAMVSTVMSAYFVGFILGSLTLPALIHRVGHIRTFAALAALAAATALGFVLVREPGAWLMFRALGGFSVMGLYMTIESWLNALAPPERRGRIFGIYMTVNLGALGCAQGLLLLAPLDSDLPFILVTIFLALAVVPVALTRVSEPARIEQARLSFTGLLDAPLPGLVSAGLVGLTLGGFWGMGPLFAQRIGLDNTGVAGFMAATILGGALLQWPVGLLSDRFDRRRVLAVAAFGAALLAVLARLAVGGPLHWLILPMLGFGGLAFSLYSITVAYLNDAVEPARALQAARSLLLVNGIGAALGPLAAGYFMQRFGTANMPIYAAVICTLLGLFMTLQLRRSPPPHPHGSFIASARTSPVAMDLDPRLGEAEPTEPTEPDAPPATATTV